MSIIGHIITNLLSFLLGAYLVSTILIIRYNSKPAETITEEPHTITAETPTETREQAQTEEVEETPTEIFYPRYIVNNDVPLAADLQIYAQEVCDEYHLNYALFLAICESESNFDPQAIGDSGKSLGLMQINRPNWERYDLDASMVYDNIEIGVRMLSELIDKYKEFDAVVMAYKGGESFADQWIAEDRKLNACDAVLERTMYWQEVIDK